MFGTGELFKRFKELPEGKALHLSPRYSPLQPDCLTDTQWITLLGPDVDNLSHMYHTALIVDTYEQLADKPSSGEFENQNLWPGYSKFDVLRTAAIFHDVQESIVGDINIHDKDTSTEKQERWHFQNIMERHYADLFNSDQIKHLSHIVFDRESPLGAEFRAIEQMGYLMTGIRAADIVYDACQTAFLSHFVQIHDLDGHEEELCDGLRNLAYDVFVTHIPSLVAQSYTNVAVYNFISNQQIEIQHYINNLRGNGVSHKNNSQTWEEVEIAWQKFILVDNFTTTPNSLPLASCPPIAQ